MKLFIQLARARIIASKWYIALLYLVVLIGAYVGGFFLLHPHAGDSVSALVLVPVLGVAVVYGLMGGLVAGVLGYLSTALLLSTAYEADSILRLIVDPQIVFPNVLVLGAAVLMGWLRDLSERLRDEIQHAEELTRQLQASEERYFLASTGTHDGIWDWDVPTHSVFYSQRWCELVGYSQSEVSDRPEEWLNRVHPEDLGAIRRRTAEAFRGTEEALSLEHRLRHRDGYYIWILARARLVRNERGRVRRVVGSISDVTERTVRDPLTQLANRLLFSERLTFMRAQRSADGNSTGVAVAVFDLDGFSVINTTLGTEMGDRILVETARRLQETLRSSDALGRAESDRFLLAFAGISREEELDTIMRRALESVSGALEIDGRELSVRVTAGAVVATDPSTSTGNLLNAAELALKSAKQQARGEYVLFSEDMQQSAASRIELSIDLQRARARGELRAVYQPIVDLSTMQPIAVEMLARWHHPNHGLISPAVFIPIAESEGLITGIGEWALDEAVKRLQESSGVLSIRVDVNLSGTHFAAERDLPARISQLLAAKGVPGSRLGIEITETSLVGSQNEASETLEQLRQLGVHRAIDDFGTGYSTLEYLRGLPVDTVKIDRSFVVDCVHNRRDRAMLSSLIQLAKSLNLRTLAEGAEHLEQLAILRELGCDAVQGYCVSRPQEWDDLQEWLRTWDGSEQAVRTTR